MKQKIAWANSNVSEGIPSLNRQDKKHKPSHILKVTDNKAGFLRGDPV